jgi:hypothetical protein
MIDIYSHISLFIFNIKDLINFTSIVPQMNKLRNTKSFWKNQYEALNLPWRESKSTFKNYIEKFIHAHNAIKLIDNFKSIQYCSISLNEIINRLKMLNVNYIIHDSFLGFNVPYICVDKKFDKLSITCLFKSSVHPLITFALTHKEFKNFIYPDLYDGIFTPNNFHHFNRIHYKDYKKLYGIDLYVY